MLSINLQVFHQIYRFLNLDLQVFGLLGLRGLYTCNIKLQLKWLTVSRLDEESVLTQYLFHSISRSFLSNDDLKYETSKE